MNPTEPVTVPKPALAPKPRPFLFRLTIGFGRVLWAVVKELVPAREKWLGLGIGAGVLTWVLSGFSFLMRVDAHHLGSHQGPPEWTCYPFYASLVAFAVTATGFVLYCFGRAVLARTPEV